MKSKNLIEEKLLGNHKDFLKYCQESRKIFVEELDREDFIAYRSEYAVSHEDIEQLKNLLNFQEKFSPPQNVFDDSEVILQDYFKITDLTPYESIYLDDLDFSVCVKNCLRRNGYKTLGELLSLSKQTLSNLRNLGQNSIDDIFNTLKFFFDTYDSTEIESKTLQEIFKIVYLPPYEDILITDLDFDNHVKNYLAKNNYKTLADLLKLSEYNLLLGFGYFGRNFFDNILKTLKTFFDSRRKKFPAETLRLANEDLDEFLRNAALNHDPHIELIISAFEKFSNFVTIKRAFRDLTEEFRDKRVRSFLLAVWRRRSYLLFCPKI